MYACAAPDDPLIDAFARLYLAPLGLAWDGFQVPALNDGWYPTSVSTNIALAARICDDPALTEFIARTDREYPKRRMIPATLLYEVVEDDVLLYGDSRLAVLKKPFHVILKSGPIAESHAHRDHLAIVMAPFSDDIGTPGYASPLLFDWYRNSPSHNCVTVDGEQAKKVLASHVERAPGGIRAVIGAGEWPCMAEATRTLTAEGDAMRDVTMLRGSAEHVYDWIFHSAGEAEYSCGGGDVPVLWEKPGFNLFANVRRMDADGAFTARFTLESGKALTLTVEDTTDLEIYTARTPGNPADRMRSAVILRRRRRDAEFAVKFEQK